MAENSISTVPVADIALFVKEKWDDRPCECCGQSNWQFGETIAQQVGALIMATEGGDFTIGDSKVGMVYMLMCKHCGNVRLISKPFFDAWITARRMAS